MESAPPDSWQEWFMIQDLYNRYFAALDNGPDEQWVDCFTPDGVLETPSLGIREPDMRRSRLGSRIIMSPGRKMSRGVTC